MPDLSLEEIAEREWLEAMVRVAAQTDPAEFRQERMWRKARRLRRRSHQRYGLIATPIVRRTTCNRRPRTRRRRHGARRAAGVRTGQDPGDEPPGVSDDRQLDDRLNLVGGQR